MIKLPILAILMLSTAWPFESMAAIHEYKFLAMSPDGKRIAAVEISTQANS